MRMEYSPGRTNFGLLPEPERSVVSFAASMGINVLILAALVIVGAMARQVIVRASIRKHSPFASPGQDPREGEAASAAQSQAHTGQACASKDSDAEARPQTGYETDPAGSEDRIAGH